MLSDLLQNRERSVKKFFYKIFDSTESVIKMLRANGIVKEQVVNQAPFSRRGNSVRKKKNFLMKRNIEKGLKSSLKWVQHVAETIINGVMMETD